MTATRTSSAEGRQAVVALHPASPAGAGRAVKAYRASATDEGFEAEVAGLSVLSQVAPEVAAGGWRAGAVELQEVDRGSRTITMSLAAGEPLDEVELDPIAQAAVIEVTARLVEAYWGATAGCLFGDLVLGNVLVDPSTRTVTLIDPGAPRAAWACEPVPRDHWPQSRDLGYLLFCASVGLHPRHWRRRARREELAFSLAERLSPRDPTGTFSQEALACARFHLDRLLELPDRRWYRRLARAHAARRIRVPSTPKATR